MGQHLIKNLNLKGHFWNFTAENIPKTMSFMSKNNALTHKKLESNSEQIKKATFLTHQIIQKWTLKTTKFDQILNENLDFCGY